ncbi:dynamin-related protein 4C-like protein [Tanacetum coccineum]
MFRFSCFHSYINSPKTKVPCKILNLKSGIFDIEIEWFHVDVERLRKYGGDMVKQAYDMKMWKSTYWKIVLRRMVDCMALHMLFSIQNLMNQDMKSEIVNEMMVPHGRGIDRMLEESPMVAGKREKLNRSVNVLRESKESVASMMDQISAYVN